jgi:dTDP-glucose 4,6-dehydratase
MNFTKIREELGWAPKTSFEEGLQQTVAWYKEQQQWWHKIKSKEYLEYYEKQYGRRS